jgi:hypothetical protein
LQASRTVRVSACDDGSFSFATAFVASISRFLVRVATISAPNGTGLRVSIVRAVNASTSRMHASSSIFVRMATVAGVAMANASTLEKIDKHPKITFIK